MQPGWAHMAHPATGGACRLPDDPAVLAAYEARGWERVTDPAHDDDLDVPEPVPVPAGTPKTSTAKATAATDTEGVTRD